MDLEFRTIRRVSRRLLPFLIVCYFVAYLDRVNVGFASLTMNKDLGISATAYGLGAGIFFLTYFIFEVPSNLFLEKFGARKWIARIISVVTFFYLTDRPAEAHWLRADEREWLTARLEMERRAREQVRHYSVVQALMNPRVLAIALVYFGAVAVNYGLSFFLPQIVKAFGLTNLETGFVTLIPYAIGAVGMIWWGLRSDKEGSARATSSWRCSSP